MLSVGIGGGGDVVGALATADLARDAGLEAHVGGVSWERRVIDAQPGPRRLDELEGAERIGEYAALAGPGHARPRAASTSPSRTWRASSASRWR